ncbi:MAG: pilus assembly protein PilP [Methylococcaceae bacterium]
MTDPGLFFSNKNRHYLSIGCAIILACLTGCGNDDFADLKQYISTVKGAPKGRIPPLPEIKAVETFIFNPTGLRDPFKPLAQPEQPDVTPVPATGSGIRPNFTRRKEELELLPLEDLKMVGTIKMKSNLWGLVKAGDGSIHRVQTGNYMGKNYGKIIRISVDKIELMEIVTEKPGVWHEQQTALALTE